MGKKRTTKKAKKSFEENLDQLEELVEALESGELPLEASIEKFEAGIAALKDCYEILDRAEKKIETITKSTSRGRKKKAPAGGDPEDVLVDEEDDLLF